LPLNWMDTKDLSFWSLLLLEADQVGWLVNSNVPRRELGLALRTNPAVEWFLRHKCPAVCPLVDEVLALAAGEEALDPRAVRRAEIAVMESLNDWLVYVVAPHIYDEQPFLGWDTGELLSLADWRDKVVIDIGAGTGRQTLAVAPQARAVFAVEPIANLRDYLKDKARRAGLSNVFPLDGLMTDIPLPEDTADVTMSGHVFGDAPAEELAEMARVTKPGGQIILCPGARSTDEPDHRFLVDQGFTYALFEQPRDGICIKYWLTLP